MKKNVALILLLTLMTMSCSRKVWVSASLKATGAKIAIVGIDLENSKTKGSLPAIAKVVSEELTPYLHQAGFSVINVPLHGKISEENACKIGESKQLDYVLYGTGSIGYTDGAPFLESFTLKILNVKTRDVELTGIFKTSDHPVGASKVIGKKIVKTLHSK